MKINNKLSMRLITGLSTFIIITTTMTGCSYLKWNNAAKNQPKEVISNQVVFTEVKKGDISVNIQGAGILTPARAVNLYYRDLSGPIKKVHAMLGDEVKAGQVIFEMDAKDVDDEIKDKELELRLQELKNKQYDQNIAIEKANVEQAKKDLEIAEKANNIESTAITKNSIEKARTSHERAISSLKNSIIGKEMGQVQVSLIKQELKKLREKLQQGNLASPINGKVVFMERVFETEHVNSGRVLARVSDPSDIVFQMITSEAKNIQGEIEAVISIGNQKYNAKLYEPKPGDLLELNEMEQKTKNKLFFSFKDSFPDLGINESVQVNLEVSKKDVLLIEKEAIQEDAGKTTVEVEKNGSSETIEIVSGLKKDNMVEVLGGIAEGTKVLIK